MALNSLTASPRACGRDIRPPAAGIPFDQLPDAAFVRRPVVLGVVGFSATTLVRLLAQQAFPAPYRLTPRTVAWRVGELRQWLGERGIMTREVLR